MNAETIEERAAALVERALERWLPDAVDAVLPAAIAIGSVAQVDDAAVLAALKEGATERADTLCETADMRAAEQMVAAVSRLLVDNLRAACERALSAPDAWRRVNEACSRAYTDATVEALRAKRLAREKR